MRAVTLLLLAAAPICVHATLLSESAAMEYRANPIRKVVNMLRNMGKKVEQEGKIEKELFDKFMCHCKTTGADLAKSVAESETKVPQLTSDIKESVSKKSQLDADIKKQTTDRAAAKKAMGEATALREKEGADHAKESAEDKSDMASVAKAVVALEKGTGGSFLQSAAANSLHKLLKGIQGQNADRWSQSMDDNDRDTLTVFLSGTQQEDAPGSDEIVGILKTMHEGMAKEFAEAAAGEEASIKSYDDLMAAKTKEVKALSMANEEKISRTGEVAVKIVQMKADLDETEDALKADKRFLRNLNKSCETKRTTWDEVQKTRGEDLVALADTVKILNDDDALDLLKKSNGASFMQVAVSDRAVRDQARNVIRHAQHQMKSHRLDFIALAMHGKKFGFEALLKMIKDMAANVQSEQKADERKQQYCGKQFNKAGDKKKDEKRELKDLRTVIADADDGIGGLQEEIKTLSENIKALDVSVKEATKQRQEENKDFQSMMSTDSSAKELLGFAKKRLNKFYNPRLLQVNKKAAVLAQVAEHGLVQAGDTFWLSAQDKAPYKKKSEESSGVIAMLDLLIRDLDKEMITAKVEEKQGQADYEEMMEDSTDKRAGDAKTLASKQKTLADLRAALEQEQEEKASTKKELAAQVEYIASLHKECDWLLKYFDKRKEARVSEIDALGRTKSVLKGADYSLL